MDYNTRPYFYGTGRRKKSVARVRLYAGSGKVTINGRDIDDYFGLETLKLIVRQPLELTGTAARRYFRCRTAQRSRAACPGQRYLPMADAEALMQKLLCGDTAPLTRAKVCAAVNKLVIDPPQNGMRPIRVYARPGVVGQGTPAHVG